MIFEFEGGFIRMLQSRYSANGNTQILNNERYYLTALEIENHSFFLCVPLHSNGKYFVEIDPPFSSYYSQHWKKHGLNLEKMLILTSEEIVKFGTLSYVENNVWEDIESKKELITSEAKKYIDKYLLIVKQNQERRLISREDRNILSFSSLNSFTDRVNELLLADSIELKYANIDDVFLRKLEVEFIENEFKNEVVSIIKELEDIADSNIIVKAYGLFVALKETSTSKIELVVEYSGNLLESDVQELIKANCGYKYKNRDYELSVTCPDQSGTIEQYLSKLELNQQEEALEIVEQEMI